MIPVHASLMNAVTDFDAVFFDVWGVLHDGRAPWPDALKATGQVLDSGRAIVLVTNAPYPGTRVAQTMARMGFDTERFAGVVSAGDVAVAEVRECARRVGGRVWLMGAPHNRAWVEACGVRVVNPREADFIVLTDAGASSPELAFARERGLEMVCANPDLAVVSQTGVLKVCAGAVASDYGAMGGVVRTAGKPHAPIFERARTLLPVGSTPVMLGDSLTTDVLGAQRAGLPAIWLCRDNAIDPHAWLARAALSPAAVLRSLA